MGTEALQEFGSTRRKVGHTTFIWPLCSHITARARITQSDVTVLTSATYFLFPLSPPTSASPSVPHSFSSAKAKTQLLSFHLVPAALCSPWLTVSAPTIPVTVLLLTPPSLSTPHVLSALFFLVPTIPSHTASSILFGQLIPDLTSPMSASFTSLLAQQVPLLLTVTDLVFLQVLHPSFSPGGLYSPLSSHISFLLLSTHLPAGKPTRAEWEGFLLTVALHRPIPVHFPISWLSRHCRDSLPLPS